MNTPEPWTDVYGFYDDYGRIEEKFQAVLDESLHPRGPDMLYDTVRALGLPAGASVVDLGCGEGTYAIELARRFGARVLGIESRAAPH